MRLEQLDTPCRELKIIQVNRLMRNAIVFISLALVCVWTGYLSVSDRGPQTVGELEAREGDEAEGPNVADQGQMEMDNVHASSPSVHSRLWATEHSGSRIVEFDSKKMELMITTEEPTSAWSLPIVESHRVGFYVTGIEGAWNDFIVAGVDKGIPVVERWILPTVLGAYEGEPSNASAVLGQPLPIDWPSGSFVGSALEPELRGKRGGAIRKEILRGGVGSIESMYVDSWMRFVTLTSNVDKKVYKLSLGNVNSLSEFIGSVDVPWLLDANSMLYSSVFFNINGGVDTVVFDLSRMEQIPFYVFSDIDNDGFMDASSALSTGFDGFMSLFSIYETKRPNSVWR